MSNYLELAQLPDGTILQGQELSVAKEMIRAGIESVSGNVSDFDEFFDNQKERLSKKTVILH
ncbi:MAG: hypothetical protein EBW43_00780 [Proteobacteria bacterium]|nr:hypothetical protein [Pseudomonadota bacterium]